MKAITKRLRLLRAGMALTQREIALRAGLSMSRYWEIENGYRAPSDDEVARIAKSLKVTAEQIVSPAQSVAP